MKILNNKLTRHLFMAIGIVCFISLPAAYLHADGETAVIRVGKFWCGVIDHGGTRTFSYNSFSWFPGDFNCMGPTMQDASSQAGSGLMMAATNWTDPLGTVIPKAAVLWSPDSDYNWGDVVTVPMTNYTRWALPYNYTIQPNDTEIEDKQIEDWGTPDASKMIGTSDQVIEVTKQGPMGVAIHRNIFGWSQEHHHNYIVCDVTLTNNSDQTLTDFYLDMHQADFYNVKAA